ncbi:MAG: response regulator [Planctomycetota bacterium]
MDATRIPVVLVLEPDTAACEVLTLCLQDAGLHAEPVATAQAALLAIRRQAPDLLLTNLRLPDAPALTLLADLRQQPKLTETPFVVLTDQPASLSVDQTAQLRIDQIIAKPFSPRAVVRTVQDLIAGQLRSTQPDPSSGFTPPHAA